MKRKDLTSRIVPPKYRVGRFTLNEYDVIQVVDKRKKSVYL